MAPRLGAPGRQSAAARAEIRAAEAAFRAALLVSSDGEPTADPSPIIRDCLPPGLALDFTPLFVARRLRGWSQPALARRAGIGVATLRRIENGRGLYNPSAWTLGKLATALGLPLHALWRPIDLGPG
jgi:DNA-binding XRE family transcriptional regulator